MKTLQILIVILLFAVNLTAQNVEPTQRPFNFKGNPNYFINATNDDFKQDKFIIGGAWSQDSMTAKMMLYNFGNTKSTSKPATDFGENCDYILDLKETKIITGGMSIQYEPTLRITHSGELETRPNDPTRPVFGFEYIHDSINIDQNDSRLRLYKYTSYIGKTILKNPWVSFQVAFKQTRMSVLLDSSLDILV